VRRRDDLREIDEGRPVHPDEDVVRGEIAVDDLAAEHPDHLRADVAVERTGGLGVDRRVDQPRRRLPLRVDDDLHEEHAPVEQERGRDPHAVGVELVEGVGLGRLPGVLRRVLAEAAPLLHRAPGPGVPDPPTLRVRRVVLEAPCLPVLVDLGGHHLPAIADKEDLGFLAALEAADDLVDHAVFEERIEVVCHTSVGGRDSTAFLPGGA
jgi:hypothetical protein